jgi:amino acid adenylation domain-containing protein
VIDPTDRVEHEMSLVCDQHPHRLALISPEESVQFVDLERRATVLAHRLRKAGATDGCRVAVRLPRSIEHAIAILACWKAGCTCVPIDPALPQFRIDTMLRVAGCRLMVGLGERIDAVRERASEGSNALAYVFFTSGSSGVPKAVGVPHTGILNESHWTASAFGLSPDDRGSWLSSPGFAISRWELWSSLTAGVGVSVAGEGVEWSGENTRDWLVREEVTWSVVVTSLGEQLFELEWPAETRLRLLITGGEQLRKWPRALPFSVVNSYGITETSGVRSVAWLPASPPASQLPTCGRPITSTQLYVMDHQFACVPRGTAGELYVAGFGLAHGYLGQPGMTAERFLPDPVAADGSRMYRTGDDARINAVGDLEIIGRCGTETKIEGVRVDAVEVEAVVLTHPAVAGAAVAAWQESAGRLRLVCTVVARAGSELLTHELRAHVADRLPKAMVPTIFLRAEALPLLPGGKIDRSRLAEPGPDNRLEEEKCEGLEDDTERQVADAFRAVLGTAQTVGRHDDFLTMGGDSLGMARVRTRLEKYFRIRLPMAVLFKQRTPERVAIAIRDQRNTTPPLTIPPLIVMPVQEAPISGGRPTMVPLSDAQLRIWFSEQLDPDTARYVEVLVLRLNGPVDVNRLRLAIGRLVLRTPALRTSIVGDMANPVQAVHADADWELPTADEVVASDQDLITALDAHGLLGPMDLGKAPLARFRLYRVSDSQLALALVVHHIVWDGRSAEILLRDLAVLYDAKDQGEIADTAGSAVMSAKMDDASLDASARQWIATLAKAPRNIWPDSLPSNTYVHRLNVIETPLAKDSVAAFRELGRTLATTPFVAGVACLSTALRRFAAGEEIVISVPASIRTEAEADQVGLFVNVLPLHVRLESTMTGREFASSIQQTCLEAWEHRMLPFQRVIDEVSRSRDGSVDPPYSQVMFLYNRLQSPVRTSDGADWSIALLPSRAPKCDLLVSLNEHAAGWTIRLEHDLARIEPRAAGQMAADMLSAMATWAVDPDAAIGTLPGYPAPGTPATALRHSKEPGARSVVPPARSSEDRLDGGLLDDQVARLWRAVLRVDAVENGDDFFESGGNSVTATRLVAGLRSVLQAKIPVRIVFDASTFADLVLRLQHDYLDGHTSEG